MDNPTNQRLALNTQAIEAAKRSLDDGAVTPSYGPWREDVVKLLNDALATELVCVLRYKRHYHTAHGMAAPNVADEFLEHANAEAAHADRLAERIVQLGGDPDFAPDSLTRGQESVGAYVDDATITTAVKAKMVDNKDVDATAIKVETLNGTVMLSGFAKNETERATAERIARDTKGVKSVKNAIAVKP